jgi:hypothetical protein
MTPSNPSVAVPTLHSLVDDATGQVPALARYLLEAIHDQLQDRPQAYALQGPWRLLRGRFVDDFKAAMLPLLRAARDGEDPLKPRASGPIEGLSLVDERQAMRDVAIAHVVHASEDANIHELMQLTTCFAALQGAAHPRANGNPLRPAVFARALAQCLERADTDAQGAYTLMQAAAQPMAKGLARLYTVLCQQLHDAELAELIARNALGARSVGSDHQRLARARFETSRPGTFAGLDPQGSPDLLTRLYQQILADPRLLPPVKALLSRLQVAVVRLAQADISLLQRPDHPTWRLLNRTADQGMAYERADDPKLQGFLAFMDAEIQGLVELPRPTTALFAQSLARLETYIAKMAQQRSERSAAALAALEREEFRSEWLEVISDQIRVQTAEAPLGPRLRGFLQKPWAEAIVQAMVLHGRDAPEAQAAIELVDPLLDSLQPLQTDAERHDLRQRLPGLIDGLRRGAASIALPDAELNPVLEELMALHGRVLRGQPIEFVPAPARVPATAIAHQDLHGRDGDGETEPDERLRRLMDERASQMPSRWANTRVDRGELATVPVQLYSEHASVHAQAAMREWIHGLTVGTWYHLFVQGGWLTAQLVWIGESRQYYLFVGQDADQRHSLTRGALERLLPEGLIAELGQDSVVQCAVDSLVQNLGDAS